jgi:hypothetical protein
VLTQAEQAKLTEVNAGFGDNLELVTAHTVHYLTSLGVDVFGLIDAGEAIDAATLTPVTATEGAAS